MLRPHKTLLGAASALAAAGLVVTGLTAASASPATGSGTEFIQLMNTSATSPTESAIVHGRFADYGVDHPGKKVDTVVLQKGSYKVAHRATSTSNRFNPKTCLDRISQKGTFRISGGTGKYARISGHGTYQARILFIAKRVGGKCSRTKPPVAYHLIITASGPVRLR